MSKNIPTVFVIFGVTGDLVAKKIVPSLFELYCKGKLPQMLKIVGFSRRDWHDETLQEYIADIISKKNEHFSAEKLEKFTLLFQYQKGDFAHGADYKSLAEVLGRIDNAWSICANKLFYLAVPPSLYKEIFTYLATSGLSIPCGEDEGWTRILVEKPFGKNEQSAKDLDAMLGKLFQEIQIYRIDHYLAKEMLQNILMFRFANDIFTPQWNGKHIEKIEVKLLEDIGLEGRADTFDDVGALKDVGQNHLLQMLALITMEQPKSLNAPDIRKSRFDILHQLHQLTALEVAKNTKRGQYKGYLEQDGVAKNSHTETYFKIETKIDSPEWKDVPITLEAGKKCDQVSKEIIVTFRHIEPCLCPGGKHVQNRVIFRLEPIEKIIIEFWSKKPGFGYTLVKSKFNFSNGHAKTTAQEYEKVLLDCIEGDQSLFVSTEEIKTMWQFIDKVAAGWERQKVPLEQY